MLDFMKTLASYRNRHRGETIVVCGCGESLNDLQRPERFVTIGVNDVGRRFDPTYLVVLNPRHQFSCERFHYVETSRARALFTQLELGVDHPNLVRFKLGKREGTDLADPDSLPYTQNSPYVALCLAAFMGAVRIGLIGVDFTANHFFAPTGTHPLSSQLAVIDAQYAKLNRALNNAGITVFNLGRNSRLSAFPRAAVDEFSTAAQTGRTPGSRVDSLKIVSYATTPVAGVPAILARCIQSRTPHTARCVWARSGFSNGVVFQGDVQWEAMPDAAMDLLQAADLVIVHNGKADPRHREILARKPVITMAHNYMWNVDPHFVQQSYPGVVVGQYQATLPEFEHWAVVPNPMPIWETAFQPAAKPATVTIAYTPSGKHERYPTDHRLYWHAKGYDTTMRVLDELCKRFSVRVEAVRSRQLSHAEALDMKRRAHIVVDECVTGSYHRNSLEGLALGCVVVNALGLLPAVVEVLRFCSANGNFHDPFVHADLQNLAAVLTGLIERGAEDLARRGCDSRRWMERNWDFEQQWLRFWEPAVTAALNREKTGAIRARLREASGGQTADEPIVADPAPAAAGLNTGVSIVIPHGGQGRLDQLAAMLASLRQCRGFEEVVVVDMSGRPCAEAVALNWGAHYIYVHQPEWFERAKALNIGSAPATGDLILWLDNDLLFSADFVENAAAELRARRLDFLIPYRSIRYLSEADSRAVMNGTRSPADCRPVKALFAGRDIIGGAGLVRKEFLLAKGGIPEEFKGWGGEDNAWFHKVSLLGSAGLTAAGGQHLYHLYHDRSGAHGGHPKWVHNPHYPHNLEVLAEIKSIGHPQRFLERFPPPAHASCPWNPGKRIVAITDKADGDGGAAARLTAGTLEEVFGIRIEVRDISRSDASAPAQIVRLDPDAVVLYGAQLGTRLLSNPGFEPLGSKTLLVASGADGRFEKTPQPYANAAAVLTDSRKAIRTLRKCGIRCLEIRPRDKGRSGALASALDLLHPLSTLLGRRLPAAANPSGEVRRSATGQNLLPVWMYWEGPCPEWIRQCQQTLFAHAPEARLLGADDFDRLRLEDRDIDLGRLLPAQRADFVRAYLLAKYGGLWIDSDCIVMKPLAPMLEILTRYDFLGYRDRQGYCANSFIGARPDSRIAAAFYRSICGILRSGKPIGWISLGGQPLTEVIAAGHAKWYEIPCEQVQPVCWSRPEVFFRCDDAEALAADFDEGAICYMLSNTEVRKYRQQHPSRSLLDEGTFFRYLIGKALTQRDVPPPSPKKPARSDNQHIPEALSTVTALAPRRMLILGSGCGRWGVLIREFAQNSSREDRADDGSTVLEGVELGSQFHPVRYEPFFDRYRSAGQCDVLETLAEDWNLILLIDALDDPPAESVHRILTGALQHSDYVYVVSGFGGDALHFDCGDHPTANESLLLSFNALLSLDPVNYRVYTTAGDEHYGGFLISQNDPKRLRVTDARFNPFDRIYRENLQRREETVSGPGSSLGQTEEIRRRIPLLLQPIRARSVLDAPCGDFNWMQYVHLGVDAYIGVDIIRELIEANRRKFDRIDRLFLTLDITCRHLPEVDVVICRDGLVHFSFMDIYRTLRNFRRSGSRYLLATTFDRRTANVDIATGGWRPLNLTLPPFNFPAPMSTINEKCTEAGGRYADKCLSLWRLADLPL